MGLAFPGSSTAPTGSSEQFSLAQAAGRRLGELIAQNFTVRRVLLINAFTNAARLDAAFGGWTGSAVFLMALAHESGVKLSIDVFAEMGESTPQIFGGEHGLGDLHGAGGIPAALACLKGEWSPHSTVSGRGINELAKTARVKDGKVLRARSPYRDAGGLAVLRGNLARQGAIFRRPAEFPPKLQKFSGVARVFDSREDALNALLERKVKKGDLVVVRYEGARGGPGLRPLGLLPRLAAELGLGDGVAFLTDGTWDAALPSGLAVELATPEATEGATLSILRDGDRVDVDLVSRQVNAHLTETDTKIRLARWQAPASRARNGYLARYARSVSPALEGAVLR
jgi:dihydroxy-acid dehydratase